MPFRSSSVCRISALAPAARVCAALLLLLLVVSAPSLRVCLLRAADRWVLCADLSLCALGLLQPSSGPREQTGLWDALRRHTHSTGDHTQRRTRAITHAQHNRSMR